VVFGVYAGQSPTIQASHQTWSSHGSGDAERRFGTGHIEQYPQAIGIEEIGVILMRYAIVIENAGGNYSAYVPDLPGCIATGDTLAATEQAIRDAIEFHLDGLREDGTPIPPPSSHVEYVEVAA
jgi:predicted RNase H-like HicB family nuclease